MCNLSISILVEDTGGFRILSIIVILKHISCLVTSDIDLIINTLGTYHRLYALIFSTSFSAE